MIKIQNLPEVVIHNQVLGKYSNSPEELKGVNKLFQVVSNYLIKEGEYYYVNTKETHKVNAFKLIKVLKKEILHEGCFKVIYGEGNKDYLILYPELNALYEAVDMDVLIELNKNLSSSYQLNSLKIN